jgi:hypothetical protein
MELVWIAIYRIAVRQIAEVWVITQAQNGG